MRESPNDSNNKKCDDVCSCTCVCVCSSRESSLCVLASTNVFKFESVLTVGHHAYVACFFYDAKEKKNGKLNNNNNNNKNTTGGCSPL